jgi:hypothetical protein
LDLNPQLKPKLHVTPKTDQLNTTDQNQNANQTGTNTNRMKLNRITNQKPPNTVVLCNPSHHRARWRSGGGDRTETHPRRAVAAASEERSKRRRPLLLAVVCGEGQVAQCGGVGAWSGSGMAECRDEGADPIRDHPDLLLFGSGGAGGDPVITA